MFSLFGFVVSFLCVFIAFVYFVSGYWSVIVSISAFDSCQNRLFSRIQNC